VIRDVEDAPVVELEIVDVETVIVAVDSVVTDTELLPEVES
jgi:hypothetical protein